MLSLQSAAIAAADFGTVVQPETGSQELSWHGLAVLHSARLRDENRNERRLHKHPHDCACIMILRKTAGAKATSSTGRSKTLFEEHLLQQLA
jgi:hypothetical protein